MTKVTTVGLDLAKSVFQVHGADKEGRPVGDFRIAYSLMHKTSKLCTEY